jgi:glutamyl/glutaminyl-tRNA synthetase
VPTKSKVVNKISDIKPVKVGVNGPDHLLDDTDNQNIDKPIANESEETPEISPELENDLDDNAEEINQPKKDESVKTVAGTRVIAPLEKTEAETEAVAVQAIEKPIEPATTQVAESNEINYDHPDFSQKMTSNLSDNMQSPKFFDTKEYHLPISQSKHSHGFLVGSIVAGILFATIVAGIALFVLDNLNK